MLKALASEEKSRADSSLGKHSRDVNSSKKNSSSRTDNSTRENWNIRTLEVPRIGR
jgi:hypothetical protein